MVDFLICFQNPPPPPEKNLSLAFFCCPKSRFIKKLTIKILSLTKISFHRVKIYLIPFLDAHRWDILGNLVHWDWETPKYLLRVGIWNFWINVQWKCSWWDRGCVDKSNCNNLPFRVIVLQVIDQQSVKCLEHLKCQFFNIFGLTNILTSKQYLES